MTQTAPTRTALIYDFDGVLTPGNVGEYGLFQTLGVSKEAFWERVAAETRADDGDQVLTYMRLVIQLAQERGISLTRESLRRMGEQVRFFPGVAHWFERTNAFARERGLTLEHYVISSGNQELIEGSVIAPEFEKIFACRYSYDEDGVARWPSLAVNHTGKTQYLFRINKGVFNNWDAEALNRWIPMQEREPPFSRMIYLGSGHTDIPAMKLTRAQGGHSIGVYDQDEWDSLAARGRIGRLISEDRVNFVAPADYTSNSQLDVIVKGILGNIARANGYREAA